MSTFISLLWAGIASGAVLALTASGIVFLQRATGLFNFAHGDIISLAAFAAAITSSEAGWPLLLACLFAVAVAFVLGVSIERVVYAPLRGRSHEVIVLGTLAAGLALQALLAITWGAEPRPLRSPFGSDVVNVAGAAISVHRIFIVVAAIAAIAVLSWIFAKTDFGRQVRTMSADPTMAKLLGIRVRGLSTLAFGLSGAMAGLVGVLVGPLALVEITLGFGILLRSFAAVILAGTGSLVGVVVTAMALGLIEQLVGGYWIKDYRTLLPFLLTLTVIAVRPNGIFPQAVTRR